MISRIFVSVIVAALFTSWAFAQPLSRINLNLDSSEPEAVLAILDKRALHETVTDADWQKLFSTTRCRRLKQGETSMGQPLTDDGFMKFVATLDTGRKQLRQTLRQLQSVDLRAAAQRVLVYLPPRQAATSAAARRPAQNLSAMSSRGFLNLNST